MDPEISVPGYLVGKLVHASAHAEIYRAKRLEDQLQVAIKLFSVEASRRRRASHEFDALETCAHPRLPEVLALETHVERHALVCRWIEGQTLHAYAESRGGIEWTRLLEVAACVVEALESLHASCYVHRDVSPRNILVSPSDGSAWLIDLGSAIRLGTMQSRAKLARSELLESLAYLAPEQTGWVERGADFRSDLYGLGASLYLAATGRAPFAGADRTRLLRSVLAERPPLPHELNPRLPLALSNVIVRLMCKEPSERYQTASALAADLRELVAQYEERGELDAEFVPGRHERPQIPVLDLKLYGREDELESLKQICTEGEAGAPRTVLLSAVPGTGASSMLEALRLQLLQAGVQVAHGRFSGERTRAYAGLSEALGSLIAPALCASDEALGQLGREIRAELGPLAGAVAEILPDLLAVIGETPALEQNPMQSSRSRLAIAIERLLRVFSRSGRGLVLIFDEFDHADSASRDVIGRLLATPDCGPLTLVLQVRPESLAPGGVLHGFSSEAERHGARIHRMNLGGLSPEAARSWLRGGLGAGARGLDELFQRLHSATSGLPLLMREFVLDLHRRGGLAFESGAWHCNAEVLASMPVTEGAAELLANKLGELDGELAAVLAVAGCIRVEFDAHLIAVARGTGHSNLEDALHALCRDGYLVLGEAGFDFAHQRIRHAAEDLLPPEEREQVCGRVGERLLALWSSDPQEVHLLDVIEHLNRAGMALSTELRLQRLELNADAARQLLASGAAVEAEQLLERANALLEGSDWHTHLGQSFDLQLLRAQSLTQQLKLDEALGVLEAVEWRSLTRDQHLRLSVSRLGVHALGQRSVESAHYAREVLREAGIRFPVTPSLLRVRLALWWTGRGIRKLRPEDHFHARPPIEPARIRRLLALRQAAGLMTREGPRSGCLTACSVANDFARNGFIENPAAGIMGFTYWSWYFENDEKSLEHYIATVRYWIARAPDSLIAAHAELQLDGVLMAWLGSRRMTVPHLGRLSERFLAFGHTEYAASARSLAAIYRVFGGDAVGETARELRQLDRLFEPRSASLGNAGRIARAYAFLEPVSVDTEELRRASREDDAFIRHSRTRAEVSLRTLWMMVHCVYGQFEEAFGHWLTLRGRLERLSSAPFVVDTAFYRGLAAAQLAGRARGWARTRYTRELVRAAREVRKAARKGPDYVPMRLLLEAQVAALRGRAAASNRLFKDATQRALELRFQHHAALSLELRARANRNGLHAHESSRLLDQAIELYEAWGTHAKAAMLRNARD